MIDFNNFFRGYEPEKLPDLYTILDNLNLKLKPYQITLLTEVLKGLKSAKDDDVIQQIIVGAYGVGKTTYLALLALVHIYEYGLKRPKEDYKGSLVSGSYIQLRTTIYVAISELLKHSMFAQFIALNKQMIYLKSDENKFIRLVVYNEDNKDSFAGVHAKNVLTIFDEGTAIGNGAYEIASTFHSSGRCLWVVAGNPTNTTAKFYELTANPSWQVHHISRFDFGGPDDAFAQRVKEEYGVDSDAYRIQVLGEFALGSSNAMFPTYVLQSAMSAGIALQNTLSEIRGKLRAGVDVATGTGDCWSVICIRDDLAVRVILKSQYNLEYVCSWILDNAISHNVSEIYIDGVGVGNFVPQRLKNMMANKVHGLRIGGVFGGEKPHYNRGVFNRRTELFSEARVWLANGGAILPIEHAKDMCNQLAKIEIDLTANILKLKPKKGDNDIADALSYTFAGSNSIVYKMS